MRVDFHCHTHYSPDSHAKIDAILKAAHRNGLGRLAITDHNRLQGAIDAYKMEPDFVIMGEEIKTTYGELIAYYVKEQLPAHLDPFTVIRELRAQGAFISIPHPMDKVRSRWTYATLEEVAPLVDAVEIGNARVFKQNVNDEARAFAEAHGLPGTAGSDGHDPYEIGRMSLEIEDFHDAESLRKVIGRAKVMGMISPSWVHLFSVEAKIVKRFTGAK